MNLLVPLLPDDLVGPFKSSYCDDMVRSCITAGASASWTIHIDAH